MLRHITTTTVAFWCPPQSMGYPAAHILLSATGIVWFGCLIWACMAVHISNDPTGSNGGESDLNLAANDILPVRFVSGPVAPALRPLPAARQRLMMP